MCVVYAVSISCVLNKIEGLENKNFLKKKEGKIFMWKLSLGLS